MPYAHFAATPAHDHDHHHHLPPSHAAMHFDAAAQPLLSDHEASMLKHFFGRVSSDPYFVLSPKLDSAGPGAGSSGAGAAVAAVSAVQGTGDAAHAAAVSGNTPHLAVQPLHHHQLYADFHYGTTAGHHHHHTAAPPSLCSDGSSTSSVLDDHSSPLVPFYEPPHAHHQAFVPHQHTHLDHHLQQSHHPQLAVYTEQQERPASAIRSRILSFENEDDLDHHNQQQRAAAAAAAAAAGASLLTGFRPVRVSKRSSSSSSSSSPLCKPSHGYNQTPSPSPAPRKEALSENQKRMNHIHSEKKRRDLIKHQFAHMCTLVPKLSAGVGGGPLTLGSGRRRRPTPNASAETLAANRSKSTVLLVVYEYMVEMRERNRRLRSLLAAHGVPTQSIRCAEVPG